MRPRYAPNRGFNLDYVMWIFTRVSGLLIILLALIGLGAAMYMGARLQLDLPTVLRWTFFPNPNHVINSNIPDVTIGWATAFWQIMEYLILFLAFTHAANGLRMFAEDYFVGRISRPVVRVVIGLVWVGMIIIGIYVILGSAL